MPENAVIDYKGVIDEAANAHGLSRRKLLIEVSPDMTAKLGKTFEYDYLDRALARGSKIDFNLWTALIASIEKLNSRG